MWFHRLKPQNDMPQQCLILNPYWICKHDRNLVMVRMKILLCKCPSWGYKCKCMCLWCMDLPQHGYVDVNAAKWWCKWKFLVLQMSSRKMHMRMLYTWCKCLNQYYGRSKIHCSIFCSKSRLSCLILNFSDHY